MTPDERVEWISRRIHEAWQLFCRMELGEEQPDWDSAADWQRDSTRHLVRFYDELELSRLSDEYLTGLAHAVWMNDKKRAGWTYGPVKDPFAKTNPSMIPFEELSKSEKQKDAVVVFAYMQSRRELGELP